MGDLEREIQEAIQEFKKDIVNYCKDVCIASCCSNFIISLSKEEVDRLKFDKSKLLPSNFGRYSYQGTCPHYDLKKRNCRAHKQKPEVCKDFPLHFYEGFVRADLTCPYLREIFPKVQEGLNGIAKRHQEEIGWCLIKNSHHEDD